MTGDDHRAIVEACTALILSYARLVDHGRAAEVADLFVEDGVWEWDVDRLEGRDRVRTAFQRRQARDDRVSRHVCTNVAVEVVDPDHAAGVTYLTLYRQDGVETVPGPLDGPVLVGEYHDRFVRTPEGWRFAHRRVEVALLRET